MRNFMKTILSAVQAWTRGEIRNSTADWNQNDSNADNYVKNRTHYDSRNTKNYIHTFDGILEGKEIISPSETVCFVKTSEEIINIDEIIDAVMTVNINGNLEKVEITEENISTDSGSDSIYIVGEGVFIVLENAEVEGITFTKGIWFFCELTEGVPAVYVSELSYSITNGELKQLDSKYIPSTVTEGKMDRINPVGTGSFSINRNAESQIGKYSIAIGEDVVSSNRATVALGYNTTASGYAAHAEGNRTIASGHSSHAEGQTTTASGSTSHAEGSSTIASCDSSHAEGVRTKVTSDKTVFGTTASNSGAGIAGHAEGYSTVSYGTASHAEGMGTTAQGHSSHAEGYSTKTLGQYSHTEGSYTIAGSGTSQNTYDSTSGYAAHAEGYGTVASGAVSHAEGNGSRASGDNSHAEGWNGTASGKYSHAEGQSTDAIGQASHSEGYNTTASGSMSHAEGSDTVASGYGSHAEGASAKASGNYSHAEGVYTSASGNYSHVQGKYNTENKYVITGPIQTTYTAETTRTYYYSKDYYFDQYLGTFNLLDYRSLSYTGFETMSPGTYFTVSYAGGRSYLYEFISYDSTNLIVTINKYDQQAVTTDSLNKYAHIVGNGTSDTTRSNAHTLDWEGNAWYSGDVYVGSTSGINKDEGSKKLATEESVHNLLIETGLITPEDIDAICGVTSEVTT